MRARSLYVVAFGLGAAALLVGMGLGIYQAYRTEGGLPTIAFSNLREIEALLEAGEFESAHERLRMTLELVNLDRHVTHNMLANALQGLGRYDEARVHLEQALALRPDFVEAHNNLAVALARAGRHEEALAQFERTLELDPRYDTAYDNLALAVAQYERSDLGAGPPSAALRRARALLAARGAGASAAAIAGEDAPRVEPALVRGRELANRFLVADLEPLHATFAADLARRVDLERLRALRRQLGQRLGAAADTLGEQVVPAGTEHVYSRLTRFDRFAGIVQIEIVLRDDGSTGDFRVRVGEAPGENDGS